MYEKKLKENHDSFFARHAELAQEQRNDFFMKNEELSKLLAMVSDQQSSGSSTHPMSIFNESEKD